jgi:hypothetical protein
MMGALTAPDAPNPASSMGRMGRFRVVGFEVLKAHEATIDAINLIGGDLHRTKRPYSFLGAPF